METGKKNWVKFGLGFVICVLIRLIPFRPPNIEPILATVMPFSKAYSAFWGFTFAFVNIVLFDMLTSGLGMWTLITAVAYGLIGLWAGGFFRNQEASAGNFVFFAIVSTIVYDAVTGLSIGPLFFGQPFMEALVGQIPFTGLHLLGNVVFAATLSPLIYRLVVTNPSLEHESLKRLFIRAS